MDFINDDIMQYAESHSQEESELLKELQRETHQKVLQPRMISGHLQGRFLSLISQLIQPEKILEVGTYTGYATLCLAEGLKKNGAIHTIEINEELLDFQRKSLVTMATQKKSFQNLISVLTWSLLMPTNPTIVTILI
jgi:caffeoyl-CoA O-methyltransferase